MSDHLSFSKALNWYNSSVVTLPSGSTYEQALYSSCLLDQYSCCLAACLDLQGMGIDWRWGEALFRCLLVDYDPASNVGNWRYVAGDDHDPRGSVRQFRTVSQGMKYDASANLITRWLPALEQQSVESKHQPWLSKEKEAFDYAEPLVDPISQLTRDDQASLQQ